ncbi:MAG: hypothetical protein KBG20_11205 [Caldilineaceae bacterium]|nr:hypothetical protein [Caldilineaceae bacterium]MBP8109995.1 hypothetical protein [Caldilineaceae bacterium]MBP8122551.1 hypothetical protein [Caldilineaceae bacterium]MBP9072863.1 hypothetical protein [Caldilineaceae bacterium]
MHDEKRVAHLAPIRAAIESKRIPLIRVRKLNGILNALEMQLEEGGDSPEVNDLLVEALRRVVVFHLGPDEARPILTAIARFSVVEKKRRPNR